MKVRIIDYKYLYYTFGYENKKSAWSRGMIRL